MSISYTIPHDIHMMQRALLLADAAGEQDEVPVGAVLVDARGTILAEAANATVGHHCAHAHAELLALQIATQHPDGAARLDGATLYCTLEPCLMCFGACMLQRIRRIVYGAVNRRFGAFSCGAIPLAPSSEEEAARNDSFPSGETALRSYNHRIHISGGCMSDEPVKLLQRFFRAKRTRAGCPA
jgi:tRNA(adenine34) deaminase